MTATPHIETLELNRVPLTPRYPF